MTKFYTSFLTVGNCSWNINSIMERRANNSPLRWLPSDRQAPRGVGGGGGNHTSKTTFLYNYFWWRFWPKALVERLWLPFLHVCLYLSSLQWVAIILIILHVCTQMNNEVKSIHDNTSVILICISAHCSETKNYLMIWLYHS